MLRRTARLVRLAACSLTLVGALVGVVVGALVGCGGGTPPGVGGETVYAAPQTRPGMSMIDRSEQRERVIELLTSAALHSVALIRAHAIEGLQPAPSRVEPLARAALSDENVGVRFTAAMTLGQLELEASAPYVEPLLRDSDPSVRAAAIYALRRMGRGVDPTPLASMLASSDPKLRARAAFILGELGDPSAAPLLKDAATKGLARAGVIDVRLLRLQIAEALIKLGEEEQVETLRAALYPSRPEDLEATALAVQIIGEVEDKRSADQLIYLLSRTGPDRLPTEIRLAAAATLARLGLPNGDFLADEHAEDESDVVRAQAAHVYGLTGTPHAQEALERMLEDPSMLVRVAAASGLLRGFERPGRSAYAEGAAPTDR